LVARDKVSVDVAAVNLESYVTDGGISPACMHAGWPKQLFTPVGLWYVIQTDVVQYMLVLYITRETFSF